MNYTPNDIQNLQIKKSVVGGYNEQVVNELLDKLVEDFQFLIRENLEMKDKVVTLSESLIHYKKLEESLQNALLAAQQTAEDIKKNAYDKADNICKEAELKGQRLVAEAQSEVMKVRFEYEEVQKRMNVYKTKCEAMMLGQLELLRGLFDKASEI